MIKTGTSHYLNHYGTPYYNLNEYTPHQCKSGNWVWRYYQPTGYKSSGEWSPRQLRGWTPKQLRDAGYAIGNWHNKPLTAAELNKLAAVTTAI